MSDIRSLQRADIPAIAGMFQRVFRNDQSTPPPALADYMRQLYLDARLLDADSMLAFHRDLVRTRPALIEGYVGAVLEFAAFVERTGRTIPPPVAIATSAAPLPPSTRRRSV